MYTLINHIAKYVTRAFKPKQHNAGSLSRYDKSLVYKLMCSHQNQFRLIVDLRLAAQQGDNTQARRLIKKFYKLHNLHNLSERLNLFPLINSSDPSFGDSGGSITYFQYSTAKFNTQVQNFILLWYRDLQTVCDDKKFSTSVVALGEAFDKLMTEKEMTLYPLYNKSVDNIIVERDFGFEYLAAPSQASA